MWGCCSPACLSLCSLLLSWSFSELPMGPHKVLNCRFKLPVLILGELGSTKCFCPRGMRKRGWKYKRVQSWKAEMLSSTTLKILTQFPRKTYPHSPYKFPSYNYRSWIWLDFFSFERLVWNVPYSSWNVNPCSPKYLHYKIQHSTKHTGTFCAFSPPQGWRMDLHYNKSWICSGLSMPGCR